MSRQLISLIAACALLAGCAGRSSKGESGSSAFGAQGLAFSRCVRAHGVPDFPDPGASISGPHDSFGGISIPPTIDTQAPAFQTAVNACRPLFSAVFSNRGKPPITAALKTSMIDQAQCMRTHGVPAYPDPTFPPGGGIETFDGPGVNPQSPAYQHAARACGTH